MEQAKKVWNWKTWSVCFLALFLAGCLFGCGSNTGNASNTASSASESASTTTVDASESSVASIAENGQEPKEPEAFSRSSNSEQTETTSEESKPIGSRQLYKIKLQELVDAYGAPEYVKVQGGSYISGLAFARLVDLGSGRESLAVAYLDPAKESTDSKHGSERPGAYVFEIWDAEPDGDSIDLLFTGEPVIDGQNIYCTAIMATERDGHWLFTQYVENPGYPPTQAFYGLQDDGSIGRFDGIDARYPDDYEIYRLEALDTSKQTIDPTIAQTNELIEALGAGDSPSNASHHAENGTSEEVAADTEGEGLPELKDEYRDGERASFAGVLHVTSQGKPFAGKGLWAYIELPRTVAFSGGSYYQYSEQNRLQVALDFYFDNQGPRELSLPDWEPFDGSQVVVSGKVEAVYGMSSNQLESYRLADAVIERVLSST